MIEIQPGRYRWSWWIIHKAMVEKGQGSIKPWEIGAWTLPEILWFLEDCDGRGSDGTPGMSDWQIEQESQRWAAMSPLERLRNYQRA